MFAKGEYIIYGNIGVCRVEDIRMPEHPTDVSENQLYYKLCPVYDTSMIFIPVNTTVFMRPIITKTQAEALIAKIPNIQTSICDSRNLKTISEHYETFLRTHQCEDLIQLIKTLYAKNETTVACGRRPGQTEQRYLKRAQNLLHGELAVALGIAREDVESYIADRISVLKQAQ